MTCWPRINGKQSCCCGTASVALGAIKGSPSRRKERKGVKAVSAKRQTAKESMRVEEIFDRVVARFIGTKHERDIKRIMPLVAAINALEPEMQRLSDAEMLAKTQELKAQVAERLGDAQPDDPQYKEQLEAALEPALVPAFALAREAGRRKLSMRHFDVQLIGGTVLHQGKIAEMKTGEGKTLVATLPAYLNALAGRGVHIVTVNDYLARRDAEWMGPIYRALGLTVGVIVHDLDDTQRRAAYAADITYGTNNEFGFDYLRDNMKYDLADCVQRGHQFAIVDEVDSILIDEARTPLIISGPAEESTDKYYRIDKIIPKLIQDIDFTLDEKHRTATLTEEGISKCERLLSLGNLYDPAHMETIHHVYQALRAHTLYKRDVDYVVKDGEVIIVDEFTGRQMPGRRWSDGLHQAVEAKEAVKVERENQTLATITFQNYFRMYKKLAGMTGTADTEAVEFKKIYNLDVLVMPTHRNMVRLDHPDVVYKTEREKFEAVVQEIQASLAKCTKECADGRELVLEAGGLHILGTERHESRRIDNQLRGRAGRQGDPGSSRFYLSLEDDLLRIFGAERIQGLMTRLGMEEGVPIEHGLVTRAIGNAQKKVEGHNFDIRKHLLEYDDVLNKQREVIYSQRREVLKGETLKEDVLEMAQGLAEEIVSRYADKELHPSEWDLAGLREGFNHQFNLRFELKREDEENLTLETVTDLAIQRVSQAYEDKEKRFGAPMLRQLEKIIRLQTIDSLWKDHLLNMDHLKEGIGLRGYGQKNPLQEYQKEGFEMFEEMIHRVEEDVVQKLFTVELARESVVQEMEVQQPRPQRMVLSHGENVEASRSAPAKREGDKVGRNDPCPCGSGKKYKRCHGK